MILRHALDQARGTHIFDLHAGHAILMTTPAWQQPSTCKRPPAKSFWQKLFGR